MQPATRAIRSSSSLRKTEDWCANLLWLDCRKCLLLMHAGALFSIFEPDLRAADLRDTRSLVTRLIGRELAAWNLPAGTFGSLDSQDLIGARTADRSALGCMNGMALLCEYAVTDSGGLRNVDSAGLNWSRPRCGYAEGNCCERLESAGRGCGTEQPPDGRNTDDLPGDGTPEGLPAVGWRVIHRWPGPGAMGQPEVLAAPLASPASW